MVILASGDITGSRWPHSPWMLGWNVNTHPVSLPGRFLDYLRYDDKDYLSDYEEDMFPRHLWPNADCSPNCDCHCQVSGCKFCDIKSDGFEVDPDEFWIKELHLKNSDRIEILSGDMLSDKHIFAAQKLLSQQFPHVAGFQDTCLSQTQFQSIQAPCNIAVQVHHVRGNHWIVTCWTPGDEVEIYDSVYDGVTDDVIKQISEIYVDAPKDEDGKIMYRICNIQKQRGSRDCALFAIAIAFELCLGYDATDVNFDQSKMRKHFIKCLEQRAFESFPV